MIGDKIRAERKRRGLTQEQLAKAIGVRHKQIVGTWERGEKRIGADMIIPIAQALGVDPAKLLDKPKKRGHHANNL